MTNRYTGDFSLVERDPANVPLPSGIGGESTVRVKWIIRGNGTPTVTYQSQKGGALTRKVERK